MEISVAKRNPKLLCGNSDYLTVCVRSRGVLLEYRIGLFYELSAGRRLLKCHYHGHNDSCRVPAWDYFFTLSELQSKALEDENLAVFLSQLDHKLITTLIKFKLDSLTVYALLHNHPGMRAYLNKPILLAIAADRMERLETLHSSDLQDFRMWLPKLYNQKKMSKGLEHNIAKIDFSDQGHAALAAEMLFKHYKAIAIPVTRSHKIHALSLKRMLVLRDEHPEIINAKWLCTEIFDHHDHFQTRFIYEHTKSMLHMAGNESWQRILLKQPKTFAELTRLHDRVGARLRKTKPFGPDIPFITHDIKGDDKLKLVSNSSELIDIATKLHNCAAMFIDGCRRGRIVHLYFNNGADSALLQIRMFKNGKQEITEYSGVCNQPPSEPAMKALQNWLSSQESEIAINSTAYRRN